MTDTPASRDEPETPDLAEPTPKGVFADSMAAAARRAGFSPAAEGEPISGHALLAAMGGIRGLVEAVLPGLVFLVTYTLTRDLVPSLVAPIVIGVVMAGLRVAARQTVTQAVGGLVGIGISAVLALLSGKAEDFYLSGFWINGVYGGALVISIIVGWPLIGLAVGFLVGDGVNWRSDPSKRRVLSLLTGLWAGLFLLRLAVELPLYYAGNVAWLGATKLLMGIPLYAPLLIVSWLMVRSVYRPSTPSVGEAEL
ncbi:MULTISPECIES: DUF3159 domain-containing protein [unclassified Cryobacterium]|uniref:DUF3159 domain-containing protein n=1 Tax=unclassified Cryobacterium TaxID=2649013 RepID=UPI002AB4C5FF|nr:MULTISPECIES: DUF3159 domain-containing protein [unclassified Cryobacterium]MDY7544105.1 DUF3159 domain-containing protein [Cryobacterium sp. 5B3]MEA9997961.1 DUF3159 domain-containing protein [Cryobacterium sp. RTS3]MEB0265185.1 DUF3159 domain-containing protein [Cryobacterium sp. 10I5]MEB0273292.1 DUF3159 domain-containing protein [Cryobacterium sp. 5B3]